MPSFARKCYVYYTGYRDYEGALTCTYMYIVYMPDV